MRINGGTSHNKSHDDHNDDTRFGMSVPTYRTRRRCSGLDEEDAADAVDIFDENDIRDVFDYENVDNINETLSPVKDWRILEKKAWELPHSSNVDAESISNEEKIRGNVVTPAKLKTTNDTTDVAEARQLHAQHQKIEKLIDAARTISSPLVVSCNLASNKSAKKERNLSHSMNYETNSLQTNEKRRRGIMGFANFVSEDTNDFNGTNVMQTIPSHVESRRTEQFSHFADHTGLSPTITGNLGRHTFGKMNRNLSLDLKFDIESLFTSKEEKRRASIAFARLVSDELDTDDDTINTEGSVQSHIGSRRSEQSSNKLKKKASTLQVSSKNLCEAMQKSIETRTAVESLNKIVFDNVPGLKEYIERNVTKRLKRQKHHSI